MISSTPAGGASLSRVGLWSAIAAPINPSDIQWRADGKAVNRNGSFIQRYVPFISAQVVQRRLDSVVQGEWDVTISELPPVNGQFAVKARVQILGVIREDIGQGTDWKGAASDAFKRAAMRFGVGAELYDFDQNWVRVDGQGNYAKPLEDPTEAYLRRQSGAKAPADATVPAGIRKALGDDPEDTRLLDPEPTRAASAPISDPGSVECPKCGSGMWDNRVGKRNPKAPDFKCRDRTCDGVIWPPKTTQPSASVKPGRESVQGPLHRDEATEQGLDMAPVSGDDDDLPF